MTKKGLHSLSVKNFGVLGDVSVQLSRLNGLVGPNGSGKTSLLRVIQFLGDAARSGLPSAVGSKVALDQIRTRAAATAVKLREPVIEIHVAAVVTSHAHAHALDEYTLRLKPSIIRQSRFFGHDETFRFKRTKQQGRRITLSGGKLHVFDEEKPTKRATQLDSSAFGLAVLPQLGPNEGGAEVRKIQELFTTFRVFDIDPKKAREPSDIREPTPLQPDAGNLAAFLQFLRTEHEPIFTDLVRDARAMVPGLRNLVLRSVGGAVDAVTVDIVDEGRAGATPLADASFGTVRALALLAMLYDPDPPILTCIEEIDHGFHPYVFDRLVELLREASARTQFIIATHSPALVNRLRPHELIVCERDAKTGLARIPAVPQAEVQRIYDAGGGDGYGLGELWFSGTLGGVPK
ncbi:MAG: AAA family ATPase [Myxococcales bacterium]|nr:AAA family ATPase [Myxococcales bacterium]